MSSSSEVRIIVPSELDRVLESLVRVGFAGNKAEIVRTALIHFLSTMPQQVPKGYDLENAFSPDGRIFQIEYAIESIKRGGTIVGVCCSEGVVLAKEFKDECLPPGIVMPNLFVRIFKLHKHIGLTYTGIQPDGYLVIDEAEKHIAEMERTGSVDIETLAKKLVLFMQPFGQRKDVRPLAVGMLFGGLDTNGVPRLFYVNSVGVAMECSVSAVGVGSEQAEEALRKGYDAKLGLKEAVLVAIRAVLDEKGKPGNILIATIDKKTKAFKELTAQEKQNLIKEAFH